LLGLMVILASVLLINLAKYRAVSGGKMYKDYRRKDIVHE
jgi:hypothetical protein